MINRLQRILETRYLGRTAEHHQQIDSTNTRARQLIQDGCPHGTLIIAEDQTAGRGRHGRTWMSSAEKDLLFSIVLRLSLPTERQGLLTLAIANAVADSIHTFCPSLFVSLKWPNDVLVNGKKAVGILVESRMSTSETVFVAGIGINVNRDTFPDELAATATSLAGELGEPIDRILLLAATLARIEYHLEILQLNPDQTISTFLTWLDERFKTSPLRAILYNQSVWEGTFENIAPDGALLLKTFNGITKLYAADVTFSQST